MHIPKGEHRRDKDNESYYFTDASAQFSKRTNVQRILTVSIKEITRLTEKIGIHKIKERGIHYGFYIR